MPGDMETTKLLNQQQIDAVKYFFKKNPSATKLSRKEPIHLQDGNTVQLPYSVIKGEATNNGSKFYALFRGYRKYNDNNSVKLNDTNTPLFGTQQKVYGEGNYGFVKGGQDIETGDHVVIKRLRDPLIFFSITSRS